MKHQIALNIDLGAAGTVPEWVELLPAGPQIVGRDGRHWLNDRPRQVLAAFLADRKDLPIDWEHSTEVKAPEGDEAPAAGWITEMEEREGGSIWGRVSWTERGAASVAKREYRYLSSVFTYDRTTLRIYRLISAGLTNKPNLYLTALNREHEKETKRMELAQLLAALNMPATATFAEALNRVGQIQTDHATALNRAENPPLEKFVPRADYDAVVAKAANAEQKLADQAAAELETAINTEIAAALSAGKITPATRDYHVAQCRQEGGLDRFRAFVAAAPIIAGASDLDGKSPEDAAKSLNAEELDVIERMGLSIDEHKKANNLK